MASPTHKFYGTGYDTANDYGGHSVTIVGWGRQELTGAPISKYYEGTDKYDEAVQYEKSVPYWIIKNT